MHEFPLVWSGHNHTLTLDNGSSDNYHGIALSSNLCKLLYVYVYGSYFDTYDLQFGLKKDLAYSLAIHAVRAVVDYFTSHGYTVNFCSLDNGHVKSL